MLLKGKKAKQKQNDLARKSESLLVRNFFEVQDFKLMSKRKSLKVLKLISQVEDKKHSKDDLVEIYDFIMSEMTIKKATKQVVKYFDFIVEEFEKTIEFFGIVFVSLCQIFTFRLSMKEVIRI